MLKKLFRKIDRKKFFGESYKDTPGYSVQSVDDLRFQVLQFEKLVKNYIKRNAGELPNVTLHKLINEELPKYPHSVLKECWTEFIDEAKAIKEIRNKIIHSDFDGLPKVSELFDRVRQVNEILLEFKVCSAGNSRFNPIRWVGDVLEIEIDDNIYKLDKDDITNLTIELHPATRGKANFIRGKIVKGKVLDYTYEKVTYFIEELPEFELSHEESMVLEDMLLSILGEHFYGQ